MFDSDKLDVTEIDLLVVIDDDEDAVTLLDGLVETINDVDDDGVGVDEQHVPPLHPIPHP